MRTRAAPLILSLALATTTGRTASAQVRDAAICPMHPDDWTQAKHYFSEGNLVEACARLDRVWASMADSGRLIFARWFMRSHCEEHAGRLESALRALERARRDPRVEEEPALEAELGARSRALASRVGRLVVTAPAGDVRVLVDGAPLVPLQVGWAMPLDSGPHTVLAERRGEVYFRTTVTVQDGALVRLEVPLAPPAAPPPSGRSVTSAVGIGLSSGGGAFLGAAAVLGGVAAAREAGQARDAAIGLALAGSALLVTGVVLVLRGTTKEPSRGARLSTALAVW